MKQSVISFSFLSGDEALTQTSRVFIVRGFSNP